SAVGAPGSTGVPYGVSAADRALTGERPAMFSATTANRYSARGSRPCSSCVVPDTALVSSSAPSRKTRSSYLVTGAPFVTGAVQRTVTWPPSAVSTRVARGASGRPGGAAGVSGADGSDQSEGSGAAL